jgi:hypothetical protein
MGACSEMLILQVLLKFDISLIILVFPFLKLCTSSSLMRLFFTMRTEYFLAAGAIIFSHLEKVFLLFMDLIILAFLAIDHGFYLRVYIHFKSLSQHKPVVSLFSFWTNQVKSEVYF